MFTTAIGFVLVWAVTPGESFFCQNVQTSSGVRDVTRPFCVDASGKEYGVCVWGQPYIRSCGALFFDEGYGICNRKPNCSGPALPSNNQPTAPTTPTTTTTTIPVQSCNPENCKLPNCFCYGSQPDIARNTPQNTPMFILLTFDDAVTPTVFSKVYYHVAVNNSWGLKNPNNCSIKTTYFVSSQYTIKHYVDQLYNLGHEIASHTVNHIVQGVDTYEKVKEEIVGLRDYMGTGTSINPSDIKGFRSPFLQIFGNVQYDVLKDNNFLYDSSLTNVELQAGRKPLWPFTLDFPITADRCSMKCPTKPFPGLWEIPMNGWVGDNQFSCGMIDECHVRSTSPVRNSATPLFRDYLAFFRRNFQSFYQNKVPMHMFTHAAMFLQNDAAFEALKVFLQEITSYPDVWLVTPSTLISWMQNPVSNEDLTNTKNKPWC